MAWLRVTSPQNALPLDLREIEVQLSASDASADYYYSGYMPTDVAWALLAYARALRATLQQVQIRSGNKLGLGVDIRAEITAVLALARDEEAPRKAQSGPDQERSGPTRAGQP